ncbi:MAG TPA: hypothetical protein VGI06_18455 [Acidimicrobiales bacterium]
MNHQSGSSHPHPSPGAALPTAAPNHPGVRDLAAAIVAAPHCYSKAAVEWAQAQLTSDAA